MASRDETIQMVIRARDEASGTLKNLESNLRGLESAIATPARLLQSFGAIAAVGGLATASVEMARFGAVSAQTESALSALAANAGTSGGAVLSAMNKAAMGTVANFDLMLAANRAAPQAGLYPPTDDIRGRFGLVGENRLTENVSLPSTQSPS